MTNPENQPGESARGNAYVGVAWTFGDIVRGMATGLLISILPLALLVGLDRDLGTITFVSLVSASLYASFGLALWFFAIKRRGAPLAAVGFVTVKSGTIALMPLVAFAALMVNGLIVIAVRGIVGEVPDVRDQVLPGGTAQIQTTEFMLLFLVGAILAPLAEEFLFRGLIFYRLRQSWSFLPSASVTAAAFAVVHMSPRLIPSLFVLGLILAAVTERYRSLYPAIAVHSINNALALGALYMTLA